MTHVSEELRAARAAFPVGVAVVFTGGSGDADECDPPIGMVGCVGLVCQPNLGDPPVAIVSWPGRAVGKQWSNLLSDLAVLP